MVVHRKYQGGTEPSGRGDGELLTGGKGRSLKGGIRLTPSGAPGKDANYRSKLTADFKISLLVRESRGIKGGGESESEHFRRTGMNPKWGEQGQN